MNKFAFVILLFVCGCPPQIPPDSKPIPVENPDDCTVGCKKMKDLKCETILSELNQNTGSCEDACRHIIETGVSIGVRCWKDAKVCDDFDKECPVKSTKPQ